MNQFARNILLFGEENQQLLTTKCIYIFGIGGVGSYVLEALTRIGIGNIIIIDFDVVDETNINRQIIALHSTIGLPKVDVAKKRCLDINPNLNITTFKCFIDEESIKQFTFDHVDFIVDAIDNVEGKLAIIKTAIDNHIPIISSMGTGNKFNPTQLVITDINKTYNCPLARVMRKKLRELKINKLTVLSSTEVPISPINCDHTRKGPIASNSFVPATAGLLISSYIINNLIKK